MKRIFDLCIAAFALLVFTLPMLLLIWHIRRKLGKPVFFRQTRPGLHGKPFTMIKFRTMTDDRDKDGVLLPDVERLVPFGRWLRATSLDELPELWNVLRGDMSLVGPRPLLMEYLPLYSPDQARRHEMRPGITGWAQVNGRNSLDWPERLALDVWYINNHSIYLDIKILLLTVLKVIQKKGIDSPKGIGTNKFKGQS